MNENKNPKNVSFIKFSAWFVLIGGVVIIFIKPLAAPIFIILGMTLISSVKKLENKTKPKEQNMFRVTVKCERIPAAAWPNALKNVRSEFQDRSRHSIEDVHWSGDTLFLTAVSDHDNDGEALADEFSDTVAAYAPGTPGYQISVVSVEVVNGNAA
jgi:ABC-type Fe2+-enterobactin transport system substrate-binding protein